MTLVKTKVSAPVDSILPSGHVNVGETVAASVTVFEICGLDEVTLTVYVTEDQIGKVKRGDGATVAPFFGENFTSDKAEFTSRNIQTTESCSTTVYATEIRPSNPDHKLKLGMSADTEIIVGERSL